MRKLLGKLGGASGRPFLHAATLLLLLSTAFFLAQSETANAQVWVSSEFIATPAAPVGVSGITFTPGSQNETALCFTWAVNPITGQTSPAATDYLKFSAYCDVISSTTPAQIFTSTQCPRPAPGYDPAGSPATGSPIAQCSVVFQPQPGVTYTISSGHDVWYNTISDCYVSLGVHLSCYADPEGFYAAAVVRANTQSTNITQEVTGTGGVQNHKLPFQQPLALASSSAIWTPKCADVIQGSVTPYTDGGPTITATFTPNFGYTLAQAAQICGFTNFDWQQLITVWPLPSPLIRVSDSQAYNGLYAPPGFLDPPPGGYTYELPNIDNAYPFYYNPNPGSTGQSELAAHEPGGTDGTVLDFKDIPTYPCLYGGNSTGLQGCYGFNAAAGQNMQFITHLAGINSDGTAHDLWVGFTWYSTFNGTSGGTATTKNSLPADPGSGTGGVTVTSVSETTNYQYPTAPDVQATTLTFLDGTQVSVTGSGLAYSRVTKTFTGTLMIENISNNTIDGPFQIVLTSMPSGVALVNATGTTGGFPYITIPTVGSLEPGQSASVNIQISNPARVLIDSIPLVYSGSFD